MEAKASAASGRPVRGILKNRSSTGGSSLVVVAQPPPRAQSPAPGLDDQRKKSQKWDEMNILATYHPPGKDYGLMKIDEPSTPYHSMVGEDDEEFSDTEANDPLTADVLTRKLTDGTGPKILAQEESSEEEEDLDLTPEEREKKKQFEMKRKMHYNEAQNIKLARQLIEKELRGGGGNAEDDEDEEEIPDTTDSEYRSPELEPVPDDPLENIAHSLEEVCSGL